MKRKALAVILTAAMVSGLYGCSGGPPDSGEQGGEALTRNMFLAAQEELYDPDLKPSVKPYTVEGDFSNVINFDVFGNLNDEAKRMLLENGFVVTDGYAEEFFDLYEANRYSNIPNFVTTDSMVHSYHLFFSRLLKGIEKEHFCQDLTQLSKAMQEDSLEQYAALKGTEWENAAKRNAAFFSVGLALLQADAAIPAEVNGLVEQELSLIQEAAGITESPVMNLGGAESGALPLMEDYTQYIPRGYYTTSEELTRYFKAMMWYGRLSFRQSDEDQSRSALLMTMALEQSPDLKQWETIYSITSFFVGASDDPGIYEYSPMIRQVYGGMPSLEKLPEQKEQFNEFLQKISELEPPVVNSIPIYDETIQADKDAAVLAFRFMGQRSVLDAAVFQRLIYREVGENSAGEKRMLPSALDIPAAVGSRTAQEFLREAGAEDYAGYSKNMKAIQNYLAEAPQTLWNGSLYNGWLNTLRPLTVEKGEGYPQFMQNQAWSAKGLNTFLGSWTELKHDTVLYAKQVYAEMGGGDEEDRDDRGYVEPEPVLYSRLAGLARATADGLKHFNVLRDSDAENLDRMAELAQKLMVISEKELKDQLLDDGEYELIKSFGGQLEHFWYEALKDEKGGDEIYSKDFPAAVVTDVATDPNGSVLEVGSGRISDIYVIVNVDGSLRIARGGVYTFYEFQQPLSERLTDEKWREMLGIDIAFDEDGNMIDKQVEIPYPVWTTLFRAPAEP